MNNPVGVTRANNIDSELRNFIETEANKQGFSTVGQLNKETQLARRLMDGIASSYAGKAGNNALGLSDMILLAQGTGNPVAVASFLAKKALSSKSIMSNIAKRTAQNEGTKEVLPKANISKTQPLTGYLKFLESNQTSK